MIQNNKASRFSESGWGALALAGGLFFFPSVPERVERSRFFPVR